MSDNEIIIDATGLVAGRLASKIAKMLLKGEKVIVINIEKAVISGTRHRIINRFKRRLEWRTYYNPEKRGPKIPRRADKIFKRMVRGMLPRKRKRGREALKRLKVYIGKPLDLEDKKTTKFEELKLKNPFEDYMTLSELEKSLRGR